MQLVANQVVILGAPGCGKTTTLLGIIEKLIEDGTRPERVAYVSFTKKAVEEAASRAEKKFGVGRKDLPFFRTVHSLCFQQTGVNRRDVLNRAHYKELAELLGVAITGAFDEDGSGMPVGGTTGDQMLFLDNLARVKCKSLEDLYKDLEYPDFSWFQLKQFSTALKRYKEDSGLLDFTDMLTRYSLSGEPVPVEVAIVDEAQDLSRLQWTVLRKAFSNAKMVYVAGDDDQSIHEWGGSDVATFLNLGGTRQVLEQSWRLPRAVHTLSQQVISRVEKRFPKRFISRAEEGAVQYHSGYEGVALDDPGSWLLIARNTYQLPKLEHLLREHGVVFSTTKKKSSVPEETYRAIVYWERLRKGQAQLGKHVKDIYDCLVAGCGVQRGYKGTNQLEDDKFYTLQDLKVAHGLLAEGPWHEALSAIPLVEREYYLMALRRGGPKALGEVPRFHLGTIHSVKGGEADNVLLLTDVAKRTYDEYKKRPDGETRVFYVGVTRTKKNLHVVLPTTSMAFEGLR